MKNLYLSLFFLLFSSVCFAQNLVPNPSFEENTECPNFTGALENSLHWLIFRDSPDYMNSCTSNSLLDVPYNYFGYQEAASGRAYAGLYTMGIKEYREIIGIGLSDPLEIGQKYYVSYKAVLAYNGNGISTCYSNNLGAKFSTNQYDEDNPIPINNSAHINRSELLGDSINWTIIKGSIIADSAYQYLAIGNFYSTSNTDTVQIEPPGKVAYYLIDDVCVSRDTIDCQSFVSAEYNTPIKSYFFYSDGSVFYKGPSSLFFSIQIIDMTGSLIFQKENYFIQSGVELCSVPEQTLINIVYSINVTDFKVHKLLTSKF
jgi:hypothetical protein